VGDHDHDHDHDRGAPLLAWATKPAAPMLIWFVFWPLWETIFPTKAETKAKRARPARTPGPRGR